MSELDQELAELAAGKRPAMGVRDENAVIAAGLADCLREVAEIRREMRAAVDGVSEALRRCDATSKQVGGLQSDVEFWNTQFPETLRRAEIVVAAAAELDATWKKNGAAGG